MGMYRLMVLFVVLVGACDSAGDCLSAESRSANPPAWDPANVLPLYTGSNPFDVPIAPSPTLHADSALLATSIEQQFNDAGMVLAVEEWTVPIYLADSSSPLVDVELQNNWLPYEALTDVPLPEWAIPDPSSDGHLTVVDQDAGLEYDLWEFCATDEGVSAGWANVLSLDGPGIFPNGLSARGSGFALPNGLIWPHELAAGRIDHALVFTFDLTKAGGPVAPATESDGTGSGANNLPEGARVQLDPSLDVTSLGLEPWEETIAVALQEYGMFLGDDGGGLELEAVHPYSFAEGASAYDGLITLEEGFGIFSSTFPADQFRVLDFGPQDPNASENASVEFPERFE